MCKIVNINALRIYNDNLFEKDIQRLFTTTSRNLSTLPMFFFSGTFHRSGGVLRRIQ